MSDGRLRYDETVEVIAPQLADLAIVLVGGQALNYWVDRYRDRAPELQAEWPFTSEDVDFYGTTREVDLLSERLGGRVEKPPLFDPSPNSGLLHVPLPGRAEDVRIDVLRGVHGVKDAEVERTAFTAVARDGSPFRFKVMHPVLCMFSRAANVIELPGYDNPHGLKQLRGSVSCAREFMRELVARGRVRDALNLSKRIENFALRRVGIRAFSEKNVDVFAAVEPHPELGEKFVSLHYPQMTRRLTLKRDKAMRLRRRP